MGGRGPEQPRHTPYEEGVDLDGEIRFNGTPLGRLNMEAHSEKDPDFRSVVDAAAASWYSQRSISPSQPRSTYGDQRESPHSNRGQSSNSASIGSDIPAWQTALQSLPDEFRSAPLPVHPLPRLLAVQPTLRQVEWNQYRQSGGFVPRTPHDYSSLMIYVSGQVNPNPCRRCILKHGPFARCIVSPPSVLAQSSLRHACANCTYQNQYKKCTNEPITEEELARARAARGIARPLSTPNFRKPKANSSNNNNNNNNTSFRKASQKEDRKEGRKSQYGYMMRKPTAESITADSFADKLRQIRTWTPRSRRRMKAEVMQWQAALATVEAEKVRGVKHPANQTDGIAPRLPFPSAAKSSMFVPSASMSGSIPEMEENDQMDEDEEESDEEDSEDEDHEYGGDGPSWVGFDDTGPQLKPPL